MTISFREFNPADTNFLKQLLIDSFNSDSELAFGDGIKMGPPGYDNGILATNIIKDTNFLKLIILNQNHACGILVFTLGTPNVINYFCLDPHFIGKNIGSSAWQLIEKEYPGTWQLETPDFSLRNHHFYEKNGFTKIDEKIYTPDSSSFIYMKED